MPSLIDDKLMVGTNKLEKIDNGFNAQSKIEVDSSNLQGRRRRRRRG